MFLSLVVITFLIDRFTKYLATLYLKDKSLTVIPEILSLRYVKNKGAAFSILSHGNAVFREFFLIIVPLAIIFLVFAYVYRTKNGNFVTISLSLIAGGALGNLFDRLFYGSVVDFVDLHLMSYHWPTFNMADTFIFTGCLLLLYKDGVKKMLK